MSQTETTVAAVISAVEALVASVTDFRKVYNHNPSVVPDYPAAAVTLDSLEVKPRSTGKEDVSLSLQLWIYSKDFEGGEVECRSLAAQVIDKLQASKTFENTVYWNGLQDGYKVEFGKAGKGSALPYAATISFTAKATQNL